MRWSVDPFATIREFLENKRLLDEGGLFHVGKRPSPRVAWSDRPDWQQANPARIEKALAHALKKPGGGWVVVDASSVLTTEPKKYRLAGEDYVVWRGANGEPLVAPNSCPHMGAELHCSKVKEGQLLCPWHGLALGAKGHGKWKPIKAHDDGVLVWARVGLGEELSEMPYLNPRPAQHMGGVIRMEARCEPRDVVANRLDPWHGVHYHPHSFAALKLLDVTDDVLTLRVSYRVSGPVCVEVDATFHSPDPRTITMTIVGGDGVGSVVETHATPIDEGRSAVIEATLATSDRPGFFIARRASSLFKGMIEKRASRLWVEDIEYAERTYALRQAELAHAEPTSVARGQIESTVNGQKVRPGPVIS